MVDRPATLILALVFAAVAPSAQAADASNGRNLAERWCAACHLVGSGQRRASADVPSFAEIARRLDFDAGRLAFFLLDPHPKMPDMGLSRQAAENLAAYIATLRN